MKYTSTKVRDDFIDFFSNKNHKFVRSAPVVPIGDVTLLFTNAGMNQFKDIFLGDKDIDYNRAVNSQKCIRVSGKHNDLEEVGVDNYHHTFFEMLGNWSFGDYYKKDAIIWSWELLTNVWNLDIDRIWVTVYKDDDEARELWLKHTDISKDRVLKFGNKDNFWEMGEIGPCGPCSEIHYYTGDDIKNQDPNGVNKLDEYREFWNLVFIEYNRDSNGKLHPLKNKHVDTGMGLERMVAILNGIESNYDTDLFLPIINEIVNKSNMEYSFKDGVPHRVIADHIRMISSSLADGVMPSNEGRGYVVRRVLRRAARFGTVLKMKEPFLYQLVDIVVDVLGNAYPELIEKKNHIKKVIEAEEISFAKTLDRGLILIEEMISKIDDDKILSGENVFKLYDTYGFPLDLTRLIAAEKNINIDEEKFNNLMKVQKDNAKKSQKFQMKETNDDWNVINEKLVSSFIGYDNDVVESFIIKYRKIDDNKIELISEKTPFYAESGGQVGDTGRIFLNDCNLNVVDTYYLGEDICHLCQTDKDLKIQATDKWCFEIDMERRKKIKSNHTATHLLHKALKNILGDHIQQAGSLVAEDKLRFDLTHYEKLSDSEISQIELMVNGIIRDNISLNITNEKFDDAKSKGAEALFGEKYSEIVRVVDIEAFSMELCGGTHVNRTGDISLFKIISESSLASGIRRIEALTGLAALKYLNQNQKLLEIIKNKLQCNEEDVVNKIDFYITQSKKSEKVFKDMQSEKLKNILSNYSLLNDINVVCEAIDFSVEPKFLVDVFYEKYTSNALCVFSVESEKPMMIIVITKDLSKKIHAGNFIKDIGMKFNCGGGGPPHFATAGFKNIENLKEAFNYSIEKIKNKINEL